MADDVVTRSLKQTTGPKVLPGSVSQKHCVLLNFDFVCCNYCHLRRSFQVGPGFLIFTIRDEYHPRIILPHLLYSRSSCPIFLDFAPNLQQTHL